MTNRIVQTWTIMRTQPKLFSHSKFMQKSCACVCRRAVMRVLFIGSFHKILFQVINKWHTSTIAAKRSHTYDLYKTFRICHRRNRIQYVSASSLRSTTQHIGNGNFCAFFSLSNAIIGDHNKFVNTIAFRWSEVRCTFAPTLFMRRTIGIGWI